MELKTQMQKVSYGFFAFLSHFFSILLDDCWFFFCSHSYCRRYGQYRLFGFSVSFYFVVRVCMCVCVALAYSLVEGVIFFGMNRSTFGFSLKLKHRITLHRIIETEKFDHHILYIYGMDSLSPCLAYLHTHGVHGTTRTYRHGVHKR